MLSSSLLMSKLQGHVDKGQALPNICDIVTLRAEAGI